MPLALSTIELGNPSPLFAANIPPLLEVAKEGKLASSLLSLVLPAKAVVGSSSL